MMARSTDGKYLIGACIWQDEKVDRALIDHYFALAEMTRFKAEELYFFAKNGFSDEVISICEEKKNVKLVDLKDL